MHKEEQTEEPAHEATPGVTREPTQGATPDAGGGATLPVAAAMGLVALFAVFHGHAHGTEMPETMSGLAYGAGFVAATAALHALGIGLGLFISRSGEMFGRRVLQVGGTAAALAGAALLAGAM